MDSGRCALWKRVGEEGAASGAPGTGGLEGVKARQTQRLSVSRDAPSFGLDGDDHRLAQPNPAGVVWGVHVGDLPSSPFDGAGQRAVLVQGLRGGEAEHLESMPELLIHPGVETRSADQVAVGADGVRPGHAVQDDLEVFPLAASPTHGGDLGDSVTERLPVGGAVLPEDESCATAIEGEGDRPGVRDQLTAGTRHRDLGETWENLLPADDFV